ncbi:MAG: UDP-2,3-diacylglucosamine diphosphatase [Candidatus Marinimicrobia bacterium]|nr:UDP-2,3-diacylglucosamine diphosphatase [Candidatus Neomarinimicrobiota bacterium]
MNTSFHTVSDLQSERLVLPFYFLSDNHISTKTGPEQKKRLNDILDLLKHVRESKGTLFILGDFFDFWFDKNNHIPPSLIQVIDALRSILDAGIEIHYLGGNHDYWIEGYLTRELGIHFYPDALQFIWEGKRFYCQHGDHVAYISKQYLRVRKILRNPLAINMLKILPINWIYRLGEQVSHYNRDIPELPRISELLVAKLRDYLREKLEEGYDIALSGHVHYPYIENRDNKTLAILGDWISYRSYGYMDEQGFRLIDK